MAGSSAAPDSGAQLAIDFTVLPAAAGRATHRVRVPRLKVPAASSPGSSSSAAGARNVALRRDSQLGRILCALYLHDFFIPREQLSAETGVKESSLCGRLDELVPLWVERREDACLAKSGVYVNGYRLTEAGRARVQELR